jgi:biopolymer transport protein ExbB
MSVLFQDYEGAIKYAKAGKGMMARVIQTCLERHKEECHVAERWVRDLIMQEIPLLSRGINTVAVIAGALLFLGLLGTICGMITLFAAVTHHGTGDPKFLAGGISESLITAKTGLAIAIPALFLHDNLRNIREKLVAEIDRRCIMIMKYCLTLN